MPVSAWCGDLVRPAALDVVEIDPLLAERTLSVYQQVPVVLDAVVENAAVRIHHQPRFPLIAVLDVDDNAGRGLVAVHGSLSGLALSAGWRQTSPWRRRASCR